MGSVGEVVVRVLRELRREGLVRADRGATIGGSLSLVGVLFLLVGFLGLLIVVLLMRAGGIQSGPPPDGTRVCRRSSAR